MNAVRQFLIIGAIVVSGCKVEYFHTQTTVFPDGSIERAILQPGSRTPDEAKDPAVWDRMTWSTEKSFDAFHGDIRRTPQADSDNDRTYLAAWKKIGPEEALPDHFVKSGRDETFSSRFERKLERRDLGLVVEYIWNETLTEVVTRAGIKAARQEGMSLFLKLMEPALSRSLGDEYDISELIQWFQNDAHSIVADLTDELYDLSSSASRPVDEKEYAAIRHRRVVAVLEAQGLTGFFDTAGTLREDVLLQFIRETIRRTIRRRDGLPINAEVVDGLVGVFQQSDEEPQSELSQRVALEWKQAVDSQPGGKDAVERQVRNLMTRICGVHGELLPKSTDAFRFTMKLPGSVVETNGQIAAIDRVQWNFRARDAWPEGYTMSCRSLQLQTEGIPELHEWTAMQNQAQLLGLYNLIARDPAIIASFKECRSAKNMEPLKQLATNSDDQDTVVRSRQVLRLLLSAGTPDSE